MSGSPSGLIPRTNNSSLGLGATGGPRGFAAGTTQVLVNFVMNYDGEALKRLAADLQKNNSAQQLNAQRTQAYVAQQVAAEKKVADLKATQLKLLNTGSQYAKDALALLTKQADEQRKFGAATAQTAADARVHLFTLQQSGALTQQEVALLQDRAAIEAEVAAAERGVNDAKQRGLVLTEEQIALERERASISQRAGAGASRIGSLALGLIGGTIGGALVSGALLGPLQDALNGTVETLQKLLDPSKAAADALGDVSTALDDFAKDRNLSGPEAAVELLKKLHLAATPENVDALLGAKGVENAQKQLDLQKKTNDYLNGRKALEAQIGSALIQNQRSSELEALATERGVAGAENLSEILDFINNGPAKGIVDSLQHLFGLPTLDEMLGISPSTTAAAFKEAAGIDAITDATKAASAATDAYIQNLNQQSIDAQFERSLNFQIGSANAALDDFISHANSVAEANISIINRTYDAAINQVQRGADAHIQQLQKRLENLNTGPSQRTQNIQGRLDDLKDVGPSKRTQELAESIERINKAQTQAAYQSQLAAIAEQKHQIVLAQRLATTKEQINLDDYEGKDRIIAINALIDRQQKLNEAHARFNQLLDIQYKIGQGVQRQQGETIQDFISRRAQYYRGLLQQAEELRAQGPLADLEAEKERVQSSIELKDLEEKKRKLIEDHARQQHLASLQEQLKASQERDRKELESRREALQKQLEASRKADADALASQRKALQDQIAATRDAADKRIDALNNARDKAITADQSVRDRAISLAQEVTAKTITQLQIRADQTKQWANYANVQALNEAIEGASNMQQLQALSGQVSGLTWTMNYLQQTGAFQGMDPAARAALFKGYINALQTYSRKVSDMYRNLPPPAVGGAGGGYAEGGIFMAGNENTPLRGDVRWGDGQGKELGIILNNRVLQELRKGAGGGSGTLVDTINIQGTGDFYRDRAALDRRIREIAREEARA